MDKDAPDAPRTQQAAQDAIGELPGFTDLAATDVTGERARWFTARRFMPGAAGALRPIGED